MTNQKLYDIINTRTISKFMANIAIFQELLATVLIFYIFYFMEVYYGIL